MKKEKKTISLFEKVKIEDPAYAQKLYDKECLKFKIKLICTVYCAVGSIIISLILWGPLKDYPETLFLDIVAIFGLLSYVACIVGGGLIKGLKLLGYIGLAAWYIIPIFPIDLIALAVAGVFSLMVLMSAPVIPAAISLYQSYKNKKEAEEFLALSNSANGMYNQNNVESEV